MTLSEKVVVLPGASRAIGRAIARRFGDKGAKLVLPVYDWPESIAELEQEFTEKQYHFTIHQVDLRSDVDVRRFSAEISSAHEKVDYLVNNIERGGMPIVHGSYDQPHNRDQWDLELDTTLKAKWLLYRHLLPLLKRSDGGCVLNLSSVAAMSGRSGAAADLFADGYSAANRAVSLLTETWARECSPGIRVNEIMLGLFRGRHAEGTRGWPKLSASQKAAILDQILLGRTGTPEEVADLVYFICVRALYMTGSVLRFDGGLSLGHSRVPEYPPGIL